ncbi:MAG: NTPase [Gloeocapsa sp. UFS-A4-WI-NPMV-4B04]|jgi:hypothetical protein|nr:NTPase [Gloeocapsa sp. UFS-A4-WI-NPMV-4B04]
MVDWLAVWGVANAVGIVFKPILEELTKDAAKDYTKNFFKDSLKHVLLREKDPRTVASGKAIKEFLQLVQQELKFRKLPEAEIKQYTKALKQFIDNKSVKEILGKAFDSDCESLDATTLEGTWNSLQLPPLPPKFNWQAITDQYLRTVQEILWESEDLRAILDSQNLESIGSGIVCHLNQHQLHERLKAGNAIVMFDGLDEVFDSGKREDVIKDIIRFTNDYPKVRVIVTSRVIGYKFQALRDADFRHFMLQDLESEQIKDFINRWHNLTFKDEADKVRKRERLQTAIDNSSSIRELAGNPLLLTMMAILNRNQELPRDRPELYNQASRVLLHQWDVERALVEDTRLDPKTIDYKDKQAMLRQVAYYMQSNEKGLAGNLISGDDLERILTSYLKTIEVTDARAVARLMINQLRTRNFILCFMGADSYAFVHRTFLEYFCAWEFVWQFKEKQTLSIEELKTEVFGKHWQDVDQSWHEVLRLIVGMINERFAGEIINYLLNEDELDSEIEYFNNVLFAADCLSEVRNKAAIAPTANKLLNKLKSLVEEPDDQGTFTEGEVKILFTSRTQAISLIAAIWKNDPETLNFLKNRAESNNSMLRYAAVQEVSKGWKDNPDTLPWLKTRALSDDMIVRISALRALARSWQDNPDTLSILILLAEFDANGKVRTAVMQELVRGWIHKPGMFEYLCDRAVNDPFEHEQELPKDNPRQIALEAIIEYYPDHPQTLPLVSDRADNDPDEKVRKFAREKLRDWGVERR